MSLDQRNILILLLLSTLLFVPFLGAVHLFDWDEINFAEISREMLLTGDLWTPTINFNPFFEKPPLFFWLQSLSMALFGVSEFAARLPNAICGIITLVVLYKMGSSLLNRQFGMLWAIVYLGSILPFLYFRSGIIDPVFNLFIFLSIWYYFKDLNDTRYKNLLASGLFLGLAMITKGPVAILIFAACMFLFSFFNKEWRFKRMSLTVLGSIVIPLIWLGLGSLEYGRTFSEAFIHYHLDLLLTPVAGHRGFFGYHFVVLFFGCFPASIFAIPMLFKRTKIEGLKSEDFILLMKILFWVVLILFSLVQSKIIHYSSLCYFPLTFLATLVLHQIIGGKIRFKGFLKWGFYAVGGIWLLATALLPIIGRDPTWIFEYIKDPFALENLKALVSWDLVHFLPAILLVSILVFFSYLIFQRNSKKAFYTLFISMAIFVWMSTLLFLPNIESYTQKAAIEFYESKQNCNCYIETWGFKSYAHLYYTHKPGPDTLPKKNREDLFSAENTKEVYVVVKSPRSNSFKEKYQHFEELYRKNGFVFYKKQ